MCLNIIIRFTLKILKSISSELQSSFSSFLSSCAHTGQVHRSLLQKIWLIGLLTDVLRTLSYINQNHSIQSIELLQSLKMDEKDTCKAKWVQNSSRFFMVCLFYISTSHLIFLSYPVLTKSS